MRKMMKRLVAVLICMTMACEGQVWSVYASEDNGSRPENYFIKAIEEGYENITEDNNLSDEELESSSVFTDGLLSDDIDQLVQEDEGDKNLLSYSDNKDEVWMENIQESSPETTEKEGITSVSNYNDNWLYWSQGASKYSDFQGVGCHAVAFAKLLKEAGIGVETPDSFYEWAVQYGETTGDYLFSGISNQVSSNEHILDVYANNLKQRRVKLVAEEDITSENKNSKELKEKMMEYLRKPNHYIILPSGPHYAYITKTLSLERGVPMVSDSFGYQSYSDFLVYEFPASDTSGIFNGFDKFQVFRVDDEARTKYFEKLDPANIKEVDKRCLVVDKMNDGTCRYRSTVPVWSMPCSNKGMDDLCKASYVLDRFENGVEFKVTKVIKNLENNIWYEIQVGDQVGYIYSENTVQLYGTVEKPIVKLFSVASGKDKIPLREGYYKSTDATYIDASDTYALSVVGEVENQYGHLWYRLSNGLYVYSENVEYKEDLPYRTDGTAVIHACYKVGDDKTGYLLLCDYNFPGVIFPNTKIDIHGKIKKPFFSELLSGVNRDSELMTQEDFLSKITITIFDSSRSVLQQESISYNEEEIDLSSIAGDFHFEELSAGRYYYRVDANTGLGTIPLVDVNFQVKGSEGETVYFYDDSINYIIENGVLLRYVGTRTCLDVPDGVYKIGDNCFKNKTTIKYVNLPDSVTEIGNNAFYGCSNLIGVGFSPNIDKIGEYAFYNCKSLRSAELPDGIETINKRTFNNCESLWSVILPKNLKTLGGCTFQNCVSLTSIEIPKSLETASYSSAEAVTSAQGEFAGCTNLKNITFEEGTTRVAPYLFYNCKQLETLEIPETVTVIGSNAFAYSGIKTVIVPETVRVINGRAFFHCEALESISLPNNLESIESRTFSNCTKLKTIVLPKKLKKLGGCTFQYCTSLTSIEIPKSLETASYSSAEAVTSAQGEFAGCTNLKNITFEEGTTRVAPYLFYNCKQLETLTIPETVTLIGSSAFAYSGIKTVTIPETVRVINERAFFHCDTLESISLPNNLESIASRTFSNCTKLKTVVLPKKLKKLGGCTFQYCTSLTSIEIPKSLETASYSSAEAVTSTQGEFAGCTNLKNITFEEGTTTIGPYLFYNCSSIEGIELPDSLTTIDSYAFYRCVNLKTVDIPNSVSAMGSHVFDGCSALKTVHLPETRVNLLPYTFNGCSNLEIVNLPDTLQTVQERAFYNCDKLTEIILPGGITSIGNNAFQDCDALEKVTMGNMVSSMGTYCFNSCDKLDGIILSSALKTIPTQSLSDCGSLEEVIIPHNVTTIATKAFYNDTSLLKVTIPRATSSIVADALPYSFTKIYGVSGTYAETFANNNGHEFINNEIHATDLQVLPDNPIVHKGGQLQLLITVAPSDFTDEIICKSTDTSILTVDKTTGLVKGVAVGSANVKVSVGELSETIRVTVNQPVTSISVSPSSKTLNPGETVKLAASVSPSTASNKEYIWESEKENIATVDANGMVTAKSKGTTKIYAKAQDGSGVSGYCSITVSANLYNVVDVNDFQSPHPYDLNCKDVWVYLIEGAKNVALTFSSDTKTEEDFDFIYIYDKNDKEIGKYTGTQLADRTITIPGDTAKVKLVSDGDGSAYGFRVASVYAKENEIPISAISLSKANLILEKGDTYQLEVSYTPSNTNADKAVTWVSSVPSVASVENGTVTALGVGITTITATAGGKSATCTVVVKDKLTSVQLIADSTDLYIGQIEIINIVTNTGDIPTDKVEITNSNESVVRVEENFANKQLRIHALSEGLAVITISVGELEDTISLSVTTPMIQFKDQDGSDMGIEPVSAVYGQQFPVLPIPEKEGEIFAGWFTGKDYSGKVIFDTSIFNGEMVLYAGWVVDDGKMRVIPIKDAIYTGAKVMPLPLVFDGGKLLERNTDYTLSYAQNTNVGIGYVYINGKGNYSKKETVEFNILPRLIGDGTAFGDAFTVTIADKQYTGRTLTSKPTIKLGKTTLKENKDYTLSYGGDLINPGTVTVTVTGKENSNFAGEARISYQIYQKQKSLTSAVITLDKSTVPYSPVEEERRAQVVSVKANKDAEDTLREGTDYTVSYKNTEKVGTATVTVTGTNGYGGSKSMTYKITPKPLDSASATIVLDGEDSIEYIGSALKPFITVSENGYVIPDSCYSVSYANNTNAAKADAINSKTNKSIAPTVTVKFKGNYSGSASKTFEIKPKELSAGDLTISFPNVKDIGKALDASTLKPTVKYGSKTLKKDTDYLVEYEEDDLAVKTVNIKPIGNYSCSQEGVFVTSFLKYGSVTDMANVTVSCEEGPFVYSGAKITPHITATATIGGLPYTLIVGKDYSVSYSNNTNAATSDANKPPTYTVAGKGAFKGKKSGTFTIAKQILSKDAFTVTVADIKYNKGNEVKPKVTVTDAAGKVLKANKDYTVVYSNNKSKAEKYDDAAPTVTIEGLGNYKIPDDPEKVLTAKFRIYDKEMSSVTVDAIGSRLYTGAQIKPGDIAVYTDKKKNPATKLTENVHYTVSYGENRTVGKGTIILSGKGEYGGTKTVTFMILPKWLRWLL